MSLIVHWLEMSSVSLCLFEMAESKEIEKKGWEERSKKEKEGK